MHNSVNKCYGQGCWLCRGWHSCCHGLMERSSHALCEKISHNLAVIQCISHKLELAVRDAVKHITKHSYFHIFNDLNSKSASLSGKRFAHGGKRGNMATWRNNPLSHCFLVYLLYLKIEVNITVWKGNLILVFSFYWKVWLDHLKRGNCRYSFHEKLCYICKHFFLLLLFFSMFSWSLWFFKCYADSSNKRATPTWLWSLNLMGDGHPLSSLHK